MLFEKTAEIQRVVVAHGGCYLGYVVVFVFHQVHSVGKPKGYYILHRGGLCELLEILNEPAGGHQVLFCIFLNDYGLVVVFVEIVDGPFYFIKYL